MSEKEHGCKIRADLYTHQISDTEKLTRNAVGTSDCHRECESTEINEAILTFLTNLVCHSIEISRLPHQPFWSFIYFEFEKISERDGSQRLPRNVSSIPRAADLFQQLI
jgi:hypothetical protein